MLAPMFCSCSNFIKRSRYLFWNAWKTLGGNVSWAEISPPYILCLCANIRLCPVKPVWVGPSIFVHCSDKFWALSGTITLYRFWIATAEMFWSLTCLKFHPWWLALFKAIRLDLFHFFETLFHVEFVLSETEMRYSWSSKSRVCNAWRLPNIHFADS